MNTKQKILLESLRLFSQRGYDAVSVEQIAVAVGIKAPSLYKHYKSKKDIFHAIFEETARRYEAFTDTISVHVQNSEQDFIIFEQITADNIASLPDCNFTRPVLLIK
ncbi:MAG: TetR/AcrR family transcriptional regulator [Muricoprocola sp.]